MKAAETVGESMSEQAAKRGRDVTRTKRQVAHLERLESASGKRLLVDLDAQGHEALKALLGSGYGATQKGVVIRALVDASKRLEESLDSVHINDRTETSN